MIALLSLNTLHYPLNSILSLLSLLSHRMHPYHCTFVVRRVAYLEICRRLKKRSILDVCEHFSDKQSFEDAPLSHQILLLEGIRCGSWSQALKAEHTKTYVSISTTSQMPQMIPYHIKEPNLLSEGISCGSWSQRAKAEFT